MYNLTVQQPQWEQYASPQNNTVQPPHCLTSVRITCWNCRGIGNGISYLQHLINYGSDCYLRTLALALSVAPIGANPSRIWWFWSFWQTSKLKLNFNSWLWWYWVNLEEIFTDHSGPKIDIWSSLCYWINHNSARNLGQIYSYYHISLSSEFKSSCEWILWVSVWIDQCI